MKKRLFTAFLIFSLMAPYLPVSATTYGEDSATNTNETSLTIGIDGASVDVDGNITSSTEATAEVAVDSETTIDGDAGTGDVTVTDNITVTASSVDNTYVNVDINLDFSSVEQLDDYEAIVYSANNYIEKCFWKPKLDEVPNLQAWVMKNGNYNSAYTGFYDLNNTQPNKLYDYVSRECEILGYDAIVYGESVVGGVYKSLVMEESSITRAQALMLVYKALGQYEYDYTITSKSDRSVMVFVSRSNVNNYVKRATQDGLINPADNNNVPISAGDFIVMAARLMELYGEPVMNETETNLLLQVYGEHVPLGYGEDMAEAFCYLKARGVLNVDFEAYQNLKLSDLLNICMCIQDKDSRTNYKEIQLTYDLDETLITGGYFTRDVIMDSPENVLDVSYDYSKAEYYDYFLKIDENLFPGFKTAGGVDVVNVFVSNVVSDNTGQYPGAYTKSKYTDAAGNRYYHFIVPVDYPHDVVSINTTDGSDSPEWINLPRGGGIYTVKKQDESTTNWTATAERVSFDSLNDSDWDKYIDVDRSGIKQVKAIEDYNIFDYLLAAFSPMTVHAETTGTRSTNSEVWSFKYVENRGCYRYSFVVKRSNLGGPDMYSILSSIETELDGVCEILNSDDFKKTNGVENLGKVSVAANPSVNPYAAVFEIDVAPKVYNSSTKTTVDATQLDDNTWNLAYTAYLEKKAKELEEKKKDASLAATSNFLSATGNSIAKDVFTAAAICSYRGDNALVSYNDLVKAGLFEEGSTPQPDENGVLVLYSKSNRIVKLNQNNHTILVGSTLYELDDDCAIFYYKSSTDLYVDFRCAYGWSSYKKVFFKQGSNGTVVVDTSSNKTESMNRSVYSFPYVETAGSQIGYSSLILNTVSTSYDGVHDKLLLTSAVPSANWICVEYYDSDTGKTNAYLFVYYLAKVWDIGYNGLCSKDSIIADTEEAKSIQDNILGYSIYNDDNWYIRAFDITGAVNTDNPGEVGFNIRSGLYYVVPRVDEYSHVKYLNGEIMLPLYTAIPEGKTTPVIINTNINSVGKSYGSVYNYEKKSVDVPAGSYAPSSVYERHEYRLEDVSASNPMGYVSSTTVGTSYSSTFIINDLAPAGIYAYFGGFPKEYKTSNTIGKYSNTYYYLGAMGVTFENTLVTSSQVKLKYLDTTLTFGKDANLKFYRVATDGKTDVYVFVGDTCNISVDTGEEEADTFKVLDADSLSLFSGWENFGMEYMLHKVDGELTWLILFIYQVIPIIGLICVMILLALSFISQIRIVQIISSKTVDLVHILTLGRYTMKEWTFRRGFTFMMIAFCAFALVLNGNIITIVHWFAMNYQRVVDIIKVGT